MPMARACALAALLLAGSASASAVLNSRLLALRGGQKEKVAIIGSGNWGSAIAKIVGRCARATARADCLAPQPPQLPSCRPPGPARWRATRPPERCAARPPARPARAPLTRARARTRLRVGPVCCAGCAGCVALRSPCACSNVLEKEGFDAEVRMWVFEEQVDGKNLTTIINTEHENVKYLKARQTAARGACTRARSHAAQPSPAAPSPAEPSPAEEWSGASG